MVSQEEVDRRPVVYAEWKRNGDANPIAFTGLTQDLMEKISRKQVPFARKFPKDSVPIDVWCDLVFGGREESASRHDDDSSEQPQLKKLKS